MTTLREDPHRAVILGAGRGGSAILEMLLDEKLVEVVAIADSDPDAPGLALAREHGLNVYDNVEQALRESSPCVAFNMTGNEMLESVASEILGAGGVIGGLEASLIWRMVTNLKKTKDELQFQASHDALTGLYNRRYIMEQLHQGVSQSIRYHHPYAVVMFDLDHFKQVNDVHGHAVGDRVLMEMSRVLKESVREGDIVGRWGGEEFIVLLSHTNLSGASKAAEQWLENVAALSLQLDSGLSIGITFSAGVAMLEDPPKRAEMNKVVEQLLLLADERMYAAKMAGRNRVCVGLSAV
ncbi:MAG: diguanylate cyclase [Mariprofundus sp.]|nr:diguanylate cyclase [Mariprofundus sp.]